MNDSDYQKALMIFNSFKSLMKPFISLYPSGSISWEAGGIASDGSFEGEFCKPMGGYIRFTEEYRREKLINGDDINLI